MWWKLLKKVSENLILMDLYLSQWILSLQEKKRGEMLQKSQIFQ